VVTVISTPLHSDGQLMREAGPHRSRAYVQQPIQLLKENCLLRKVEV
jgi:hypothetical protein